jgi:methylthioribose-1-phosphate isomerase
VAQGIRELWIRGAPAIGIAAAMGIALGAQGIKEKDFSRFHKKLQVICNHLLATRPTAVNLAWAVHRMRQTAERNQDQSVETVKKILIEESQRILLEDIQTNKTLGKLGSDLIGNGQTILTHCNAGSLATGGYGTALGVIRAAKESGKKVHVFADETRPVLQGSRLTAWELKQDKIPVTLITDNMAGYFMGKGLISLCIVGADRIAANGDVANKIGTYSVAILAHEHQIPFYVAAPTSTIDFSMPTGEKIPIEERSPMEVSHVVGKVNVAPSGILIANPAFDVTPARYITGIITEKGIFKPQNLKKLKKTLLSS